MTTARTTGATTVRLHERLRADLVLGRFAPGSPLRVSTLAQQYGASMTSVREALVRLAEQHLAVLTPNAGFRSATLDAQDLIDLTDLRVLVEAGAFERSVARGDLGWEASVVAAHHVLERTSARRDGAPGTTAEWAVAHAAFHDALVAGCGNPRLVDLTRRLRDSAEPYRQRSDSDERGRDRDVAGEHRALLELAVGRRAADAAAALRAHIRLTTQLLLDGALREDRAPRQDGAAG